MSFQNDVSNALLNMYDVRNKLSGRFTEPDWLTESDHINESTNVKIFDLAKDNDGTSITIGDCIEDVIEMLENYDNGESSTW